MTNATDLILRGRKIETDINGMVSLTDIHQASGFSKNRTPGDWMGLETTIKRILKVLHLNTGKTGKWTKDEYRTATYAKRGNGGGTFADPRLALDYAEYLNPALAMEVKEVFLRYKAGDATLADEILEKSDDAGNEWAAIRALGRVKRRKFTDALNDHGVSGPGFGICTNQVYEALFDAPAKKLKEARGLPAKANLRDTMATDELIYVMAAETLSSERIIEERPSGNSLCAKATRRSSDFIRQAIEADRKDRQRPII